MRGLDPLPPGKPRVVAFLQNQWFKNPDAARRTYQQHAGDNLECQARLHAMFLFMGCLTGRRIKKVFGDAVDWIVWENVSKEIGGQSSSAFPADPAHMVRVIEHYKPKIVLAFGRIAKDALLNLGDSKHLFAAPVPFTLIVGPHPAARGAEVPDQIRVMAENFRVAVEKLSVICEG